MLRLDAYVWLQAGLVPQCDGLVPIFSVLALDFVAFFCFVFVGGCSFAYPVGGGIMA